MLFDKPSGAAIPPRQRRECCCETCGAQASHYVPVQPRRPRQEAASRKVPLNSGDDLLPNLWRYPLKAQATEAGCAGGDET